MQTTQQFSRRQVLKLLGITGTTVALAACAPPVAPAPSASSEGSSASTGGPSGKVVMWAFPLTKNDPETIWNPLVEKFTKEYPNVQVEVQMQSLDARREKMLAAAAAKATPDLAYLNNDMVFSFAQADAIVSLDDYLQKIAPELSGQYPKGMIDGLKYSGKLMMLPILSGAVCGLYNKTLYQESGLDPAKNPQTNDDILNMCVEAKKKGYYGTGYRVNNLESFTAYLYGFGGRLLSADHQTSLLDSPESVETFKFIVDLFKQEYVPKAGATAAADAAAAAATDYFAQQKQISTEYTSNMSLIGQYEKQVSGIQLGVTEVLKAKDGTRRSTPTLGCLGIFSAGQNRDAAAYWLTWLLRPENLAFYNTQGGFVPPTASAREKWEVDPVTKEWGGQVENIAVDQDIQYYYNSNITFIQPVLSAAALGQMAPEDAAKQAATQMNDYIKENPLK
ncbi:MAG: extracellular solute-binding protein [Chloroflexi bacterium]|nr:extracellular solute-binding protein [Chloroflexota bacterium]